jgi:hypothetical protein
MALATFSPYGDPSACPAREARLTIIARRLTTTRLLAGACICAALALGLADAPRGRADAPGASIAFSLEAGNGYAIFGIAFSSRADGRGDVTLIAGKKGATAIYFAPATVLASDAKAPSVFHPPSLIRADLGTLGKIDLEFVPSGGVKREHWACKKSTLGIDAGSYQGIFEFHGEEGYTEASATSVPAWIGPLLSVACTSSGWSERSGPGLRGARLRLLSERGGQTVRLQANKNRPGAAMRYEATIEEHAGRIEVQRSIQGKAPAASLVPSDGLRIATFEPPAPFGGRAIFRHDASPANRWTGDLTADFPGKSDVPLAGTSFDASLVPAVRTEDRRGGR